MDDDKTEVNNMMYQGKTKPSNWKHTRMKKKYLNQIKLIWWQELFRGSGPFKGSELEESQYMGLRHFSLFWETSKLHIYWNKSCDLHSCALMEEGLIFCGKWRKRVTCAYNLLEFNKDITATSYEELTTSFITNGYHFMACSIQVQQT